MKIENIKIHTIDTDKLIEFLGIELKQNEKLSIDNFGVFEDKFGIDTDCVFWRINNAYIDNIAQPSVDIECRIRTYAKDGSYTIRMDKADFVKTITLESYLSIAVEVQLIEFIRYNYNPRISSNQKLLMQYIKDSITVNS